MELKEIAVVSGKPGLFKIIKPAKNGVILETMDGTAARFIAGTSTKVSVLGEISVYTESGDNVALEEVFQTIYAKYGKTLKVDAKATDFELRNFFEEILPSHDRQRVYHSDIKKITVWYGLLLTAGFEDLFAKKPSSDVTETAEPKKEKKTTKKEVVAETKEEVTTVKKEAKATSPKKEKKEVAEEAPKKPAAKKAVK
jgi:hypothetical protein